MSEATYSAGQQLWCSGCAASWRFGEHGTICPNCGKTGGVTSLVGEHEHKGRLGTWAQGDCVFFEGVDGFAACRLYRQEMTQAKVGISTHRPDGLRVREYAKEAAEWRQVAAEERAARLYAEMLVRTLGGTGWHDPAPPWGDAPEEVRADFRARAEATLGMGR